MNKLISIDLYADFGMLKKPDTNEPVYLTFNMLHKPVLLGILGAIAGLKGFENKGVMPEYYQKLKDLKVGIRPLNHEKGNYQKTIITYNNTTGMASKETGGNLMVTEQTLIAPAFRCYFLWDMDKGLHRKIDKNLSENQAEYLPYLGKNEFSVWWNNYRAYNDFVTFEPSKESFKISSVYIKTIPVKDGKDIQPFIPGYDSAEGNSFSYFENLPVGYIQIKGKKDILIQYEYRSFAFTDWDLKSEYAVDNLYKLENDEIIQLF